jgi:hypothetical protein
MNFEIAIRGPRGKFWDTSMFGITPFFIFKVTSAMEVPSFSSRLLAT